MASRNVRDAFETRLQNVAPAALPYVDTNNLPPEVAALPDRWCTLDYVELDERQLCFGDPGNNLHRESGVANVRLFTRPGDTETPLLDHAETLRDAMRGQAFSGVVVNEVNAPATGPGYSDGAWREAVIAIDYEYDRYI